MNTSVIIIIITTRLFLAIRLILLSRNDDESATVSERFCVIRARVLRDVRAKNRTRTHAETFPTVKYGKRKQIPACAPVVPSAVPTTRVIVSATRSRSARYVIPVILLRNSTPSAGRIRTK